MIRPAEARRDSSAARMQGRSSGQKRSYSAPPEAWMRASALSQPVNASSPGLSRSRDQSGRAAAAVPPGKMSEAEG